jgi:hypothetical protein
MRVYTINLKRFDLELKYQCIEIELIVLIKITRNKVYFFNQYNYPSKDSDDQKYKYIDHTNDNV